MRISLYLDEDAQDNDLIQALTLRGVNVLGAWAAGKRQRDDENISCLPRIRVGLYIWIQRSRLFSLT